MRTSKRLRLIWNNTVQMAVVHILAYMLDEPFLNILMVIPLLDAVEQIINIIKKK